MDEAKRNFSVPLVVAILLAASLLVGILYLGRAGPRRPAAKVPEKLPPLGPAEKQYAAKIQIVDLRLSQFENFLGQSVTYVEGQVVNRGTHSIAAIELTFEFKDLLNQTVLRETERVLGGRTPPLGPGLARTFRIGFDNIPADWDRHAPEIRVTGLILE